MSEQIVVMDGDDIVSDDDGDDMGISMHAAIPDLHFYEEAMPALMFVPKTEPAAIWIHCKQFGRCTLSLGSCRKPCEAAELRGISPRR